MLQNLSVCILSPHYWSDVPSSQIYYQVNLLICYILEKPHINSWINILFIIFVIYFVVTLQYWGYWIILLDSLDVLPVLIITAFSNSETWAPQFRGREGNIKWLCLLAMIQKNDNEWTKEKNTIMKEQILLSFSYCRHEMGFLVSILGLSLEMFACAGGYKGKKDGYSIPAATDIFLSVSRTSISFVLCSCFSVFHHVHICSLNPHPFRYITSIGPHTSGTAPMNLNQRGS